MNKKQRGPLSSSMIISDGSYSYTCFVLSSNFPRLHHGTIWEWDTPNRWDQFFELKKHGILSVHGYHHPVLGMTKNPPMIPGIRVLKATSQGVASRFWIYATRFEVREIWGLVGQIPGNRKKNRVSMDFCIIWIIIRSMIVLFFFQISYTIVLSFLYRCLNWLFILLKARFCTLDSKYTELEKYHE